MKIVNLSENNTVLNRFIAEIRDVNIQQDSLRFRRNIERIGEIMAYEISKELSYESVPVTTPNGISVENLPADTVVLGTILRAGLPLHAGFHNYFDRAENAFVSAYRKYISDNEFEVVVEYLASPRLDGKTLLLVDPMLATGISGLILTVVGVIGARQFLIWMDTPKEVLNLAATYLKIYFMGMTATMVYNFGAAILRAVGDTKRPLYYLLFSGVVNVGLNLLFVIKYDMDVAGVALATVISQCISAVLVLRCLIKETGAIHLDLRCLRIDRGNFFKILQVGLPAGFQGVLFSLSNVVIQSSVNGFGETVVAGNSAAGNIEGFVYMAMNAFHQAAISFTSQNMGAGKYSRINKILYVSQLYVVIVGLTMGLFVIALGKPLLGLYSGSEAVIDAGMVRLKYIVTLYFLCGMMDVMVGSLRGLGYAIMPMIVSLIGACGLRLVWIATVFQIPKYHTIEMVYITYPITWILTFLAHVVCFVVVRRKLPRKDII